MASAEERGSALSEIEVSGPALTGGTKATIELSASGTGRARFPIGDYGKYDATARNDGERRRGRERLGVGHGDFGRRDLPAALVVALELLTADEVAALRILMRVDSPT
jgi:hypothetical protein